MLGERHSTSHSSASTSNITTVKGTTRGSATGCWNVRLRPPIPRPPCEGEDASAACSTTTTARRLELLFTGDIIDAGEALRLGLVNRVVAADELGDATRELAERLAQGPTLAYGFAKAAVYESAHRSFESLLDFEARNQKTASPFRGREGRDPILPRTTQARVPRPLVPHAQESPMEQFDGPLFDCDNHYYEAEDAFMRHVPRKMQKRCVQWVEMDGRAPPSRRRQAQPRRGQPHVQAPSPSPACCASTTAATRTARRSSS